MQAGVPASLRASALAVLLLCGCAAAPHPAGTPAAGPAPAAAASAATAGPRPAIDVIGVTHADGRYSFTTTDYLNEGADALLSLGTRIIKVWLTNQYRDVYPFHTDWPAVTTVAGLAATSPYARLFAKPFTTFIMETYEIPPVDWQDGLSADEARNISGQFEELTAYLLTTYAGTGKTFVLQNWEADNALGRDPTPIAIQGMIDWANARQAGIEAARARVGGHGVTVAGAFEVNRISTGLSGPRAVNAVVPFVRADLYSYSNWESGATGAQLERNLDYLRLKAPESALYGRDDIYMGEFGAPENLLGGERQALAQTRVQVETALRWGVRYAVYWELYCNVPLPAFRGTGRPSNDDMSGYWLIRPDGSRTASWDYLHRLLTRGRASGHLPPGVSGRTGPAQLFLVPRADAVQDLEVLRRAIVRVGPFDGTETSAAVEERHLREDASRERDAVGVLLRGGKDEP